VEIRRSSDKNNCAQFFGKGGNLGTSCTTYIHDRPTVRKKRHFIKVLTNSSFFILYCYLSRQIWHVGQITTSALHGLLAAAVTCVRARRLLSRVTWTWRPVRGCPASPAALQTPNPVSHRSAAVLLLVTTGQRFFSRESSYCFQRVLAIAILSVCLSHGWISQKRCKLRSPNLHHRMSGRL